MKLREVIKLESYSLCKPIKGLSKQYSLIGRSGATGTPLVYLQRPKHITDDAVWETIVESIEVKLPVGFEI